MGEKEGWKKKVSLFLWIWIVDNIHSGVTRPVGDTSFLHLFFGGGFRYLPFFLFLFTVRGDTDLDGIDSTASKVHCE